MTRATHPARFTPAIVAALGALIEPDSHVHDPFAGSGERLGALADQLLGFTFTGTEIEASYIVDARVRHGDSIDPDTYPSGPHIIVTSPAYPNGMADHFAAADTSTRHTYRQAIALIEGGDRPLHPNNLGRYGYRGRGPGSRARFEYWRIANSVVDCWSAPRALVNVKDFRAGDHVEPVVDDWRRVLEHHGYIVRTQFVATPGQRHGANGDRRVGAEAILDARRP